MGGVAVAVGHGADGSGSAYGYARSLGSPIGAGGVEVGSANAAVARLCMGVARGVRGAALLLGRRVGGCAGAVAHPWRWAYSGLELSSVSSPGFCVEFFRPLSFVLLCVCFLLVAV